jgi:hypothetical protein
MKKWNLKRKKTLGLMVMMKRKLGERGGVWTRRE